MSFSTYTSTQNGRIFSGGGPSQSVDPSNGAFAGGSYTPAGTPTSVGGAFSTPGAAGGPPPSFGAASIAFARNDRGSNIRMCALPHRTLEPSNPHTHAHSLTNRSNPCATLVLLT